MLFSIELEFSQPFQCKATVLLLASDFPNCDTSGHIPACNAPFWKTDIATQLTHCKSACESKSHPRNSYLHLEGGVWCVSRSLPAETLNAPRLGMNFQRILLLLKLSYFNLQLLLLPWNFEAQEEVLSFLNDFMISYSGACHDLSCAYLFICPCTMPSLDANLLVNPMSLRFSSWLWRWFKIWKWWLGCMSQDLSEASVESNCSSTGLALKMTGRTWTCRIS